MKQLKMFQIDAFTSVVFRGNPAAICPLTNWLSDELMQAIAAENNLAETAFFIQNSNNYDPYSALKINFHPQCSTESSSPTKL